MKREIVQRIKKPKNIQKENTVRLKKLFRKYKKWFSREYIVYPFKEPCMLFIRRSGQVEFYENVKGSLFEFNHSDDSKRFIITTPSKQLLFGFGNKRFKGYICHEDYPLPLPQDPILTSEQVNVIVEKSLNDIKKWKAQEIRAKTGLWKWILIGTACIILAYFLGKMLLAGQVQPQTVATMKDSTVKIVNQTILG